MNRQQCLDYQTLLVNEAAHCRQLIETIPTNLPILLKYYGWCRENNNWAHFMVACEVTTFNSTSVRARIIAVDRKDALPFSDDFNDGVFTAEMQGGTDQHPLRLKSIQEFHPIEEKELPLLMSYGLVYPRLAQILAGKDPTTQKKLVHVSGGLIIAAHNVFYDYQGLVETKPSRELKRLMIEHARTSILHQMVQDNWKSGPLEYDKTYTGNWRIV